MTRVSFFFLSNMYVVFCVPIESSLTMSTADLGPESDIITPFQKYRENKAV
jgi:hypothetical protein